mmetsp:Transcript_90988/g.288212  ORF Transcript_90988/g.288212 Transcript_90988/m.288212 type:complete len:222 (-) Transcript_90988:199-864(-)
MASDRLAEHQGADGLRHRHLRRRRRHDHRAAAEHLRRRDARKEHLHRILLCHRAALLRGNGRAAQGQRGEALRGARGVVGPKLRGGVLARGLRLLRRVRGPARLRTQLRPGMLRRPALRRRYCLRRRAGPRLRPGARGVGPQADHRTQHRAHAALYGHAAAHERRGHGDPCLLLPAREAGKGHDLRQHRLHGLQLPCDRRAAPGQERRGRVPGCAAHPKAL